MPQNPTPLGGEVQVNSTTLNDQNWSRVATLAGGGHVVIWHSFGQDGSGLGVYFQRYDAAGAPIGGEVQVNSTTVDDQVCPVVAALAGGGFVVAWFSSNQDGSGDGIFAQRYDAAGVPQGGEVQVNSYTPNHQQSASIAGLADGGYVIAWQSIGQDGAGHGVYAQRYDAAGVPQGGEFRVNTTTSSIERDPSVAALADGGYVIAWHAFFQDGSDFGIFAQRYDASGVPQGGEVLVNTTTASTQRTPVVAGLADGGYVVTWWSLGQDGSGFGIFEQRYDAMGVPQGGEVQVNTTTSGEQQDAWVAALADGGHIVVWSHADGSDRAVFAQRYDATGAPQGGEVQVNTTAVTETRDAHVAGFAAGGYIIVWSSLNQDGSGYGVYAQRYGVAAINGTPGDDFLVGTAGDDEINGLGGNDAIEGRAGADHIEGGEGSDFLSGQQHNDILIGGAGDDLFRGGSGDDVIDGGDGFDRISHFPTGDDALPGTGVTVSLLLQGAPQNTGHGWDTLTGIEALSGTEYSDTLIGDGNDNWLWTGSPNAAGLTGTDIISGNGGDDLIQASPGDHQLDGGSGSDSLSLYDNGTGVTFAGASVSLLLQGAAQDTRQGMMVLAGFENISGTTFDDALIGDAQANILAGYQGADTLVGGAGDDTLLGDGWIGVEFRGPVVIVHDITVTYGESEPGGDDVLDGGEGDDMLVGGDGIDTANYANATDGMYVNLAAGFATGLATVADGTDTLVGVENVVGSERDDELFGDGGSNAFSGLAGDDLIQGGAGDDHIEGGGGSDFLSGQQGDDALIGEDGNDLLRGGTGDDLIDGGDGFDRVSHAPTLPDTPAGGVTVSLLLQGVAQNTGHGWDTLTGIEALSGTEFDDLLIGNEEDNWLWTGHGPTGITGNDTISGNGGDDLIQASPGNHMLAGGAGTDSLSLYDNGTEVSFAGASVSLLLQGAPQNTRQGMMVLEGFENLSGTIFDDALTGDDGGNLLAGSLGDDVLSGGAGHDRLLGDGMIAADTGGIGTAGPIIIIEDLAFARGGAAGDDTLNGGKGDDLLNGGGGSDTLSGGQGRDIFEFGPASGHDRIIDFANAQDKIRFDSGSGVEGISDLTIVKMGKDVLISWGGGSASILLEKTNLHQIDASDFLFGDDAEALALAMSADFGRGPPGWLITTEMA